MTIEWITFTGISNRVNTVHHSNNHVFLRSRKITHGRQSDGGVGDGRDSFGVHHAV